MSKTLTIAAAILASVAALMLVFDAPREAVAATSAAVAIALVAAAYGRAVVDWIAAGARYEA